MGSVPKSEHSFSSQALTHLPSSLLDFLKSSPTPESSISTEPASTEPPLKRRRTSKTASAVVNIIKPIQYVVLSSTTIDIDFPRQEADNDPIAHYQKTKPIKIYLSEIEAQKFRILIEYLPTGRSDVDYVPTRQDLFSGSPRRKLLETELTAADLPVRDVELAMLSDVNWTRRKGQGKIWADTTLRLHRNNDVDHLAMTITLKWEKTDTLLHVPQWEPRKMLQLCLGKYLPGRSDDEDNEYLHTPAIFYHSAYVPDKDDPIASSLRVPDVETELYPFQKRAVQWLLRREGVQWSGKGLIEFQEEPLNVDGLPPSFTKARDYEGTEFFFSDQMRIATTDIGPFQNSEGKLRGGILAEEMGLGKTLEIISLIALHKFPVSGNTLSIPDGIYVPDDVLPIKATLLVVPFPLLSQWISEIERHSPNLKVLHYQGFKHGKRSFEESRQTFASQDIVVTTYDVLSSEIHFATPPPERQMRKERVYERATSPLPKCLWWRVCLDEAQMIQGGVSAAAQVAIMIPRLNAWGISGTPVKREIADLYGLLIFLKYEPYASNFNLWTHLLHSRNFVKVFKRLALRHTKHIVRDEIQLPPQKRFVITMPFTPIEEQHYQTLFQAMAAECDMDLNGAPLTDDWVPNYARMRAWLIRLRQTALHPEIGGHNRRALGRDGGPLSTLDEIVVKMLDRIDERIRIEERSRLISKLKRGQMLENGPRVNEALELWSSVLQESSAFSEDIRKQLDQEIRSSQTLLKPEKETASSSEENSQNGEESPNLGALRHRLRSALEVQHMAVFFQANAYFQLKEMVEPDSLEFKQLETKELEGYTKAKELRIGILHEILNKATHLMNDVAKKDLEGNFTGIPEIFSEVRESNAEYRRLATVLGELGAVMNAQADQFLEWRNSAVKLLTKSLVDDEEVEITGDEYEESTKTQDEVMVLVMALRSLVSDRHRFITGQTNYNTETEVKSALIQARQGNGPYPQKTIELLEIRQMLAPNEKSKSLRALVSEARSLAQENRVMPGKDNVRHRSNFEPALRLVQNQLTEQTKVNQALEHELELFTSTMNTRLEYYRQLQQVSDTVAPYEGEVSDLMVQRRIREEEELSNQIAAAQTKRRYFLHLRTEAQNSKEKRICIICQDEFQFGVFTRCGHAFCKHDFKLWWATHRNCPTCKQRLSASDIHNIVCKSQVLQGQADSDVVNEEHGIKTARKSAIYSEISKSTLSAIRDINLGGNSTFTTKVDTLAKHIIWLRETDPGAKSIIFCQYKEFLHVLAMAFTRYKIGHDSIEKKGGIDRFKNDPSKEVFLLHARAHSSGLNLVNASHVFLCEPLLQTALELQAIARVDRIGQTQATTVWLYLIDGTVEESIYDISVTRRLEHIGKSDKGKSREDSMDPDLSESNIEQANTMELQDAGMTNLFTKNEATGEVVPDHELWKCLFGSKKKTQAQVPAITNGDTI